MGMTRYTLKSILETIFRRWFWLVVCAFVFALGISAFYWYRYHSSYEVSATFIPAHQAAAADPALGNYSVAMSQSFVKHEEVLEAVAKSVSFEVSIDELNGAISSDYSETNVAVIVHVKWHNREQAYAIMDALKANLAFAITNSAKAGTIKWLDNATEGGAPVAGRAQASFVFLAGALVGIVVGAALSFLIGCFDKRIYDINAVCYNGDVRVIGCVSRQTEGKPEFAHRRRQQVAAIAMYLKRLSEAHEHSLFMCISPTTGCGVSTIVQDVAQTLAGMHLKVLIVLIQSEQNRRFIQAESVIVPLSPGVDRCVFSWDGRETNPDFDGPISGTLAREAKKYSLVLVDCPPLLSNIQMSGFAAGMDATLLVCGTGISTQEDVNAAVSLLTRAEPRPVYCVWNFVPRWYANTYLPIEATAEQKAEQRKEADESKSVGADVRL